MPWTYKYVYKKKAIAALILAQINKQQGPSSESGCIDCYYYACFQDINDTLFSDLVCAHFKQTHTHTHTHTNIDTLNLQFFKIISHLFLVFSDCCCHYTHHFVCEKIYFAILRNVYFLFIFFMFRITQNRNN